MSASHGCQRTVGFKQQLPHCTGYDAELVVASRHESGRSEGPALFTFRLCTLYPLAQDIRKIDNLISHKEAGAAFPMSVPVKSIPIAENAIAGFFNPFQIKIPLLLEFVDLFV